MKIFFIGTVELSLKSLEKILECKGQIIGVATKEKSAFNSDFADLTQVCETHSIPYKFVSDINSPENIAWIKGFSPDIIFCFGWSSLIKKELLSLAPMGIIGYHPTALPANRGRHPLIWALALGLKETASTYFFMDEGADSGDILSQKKIYIEEKDDARDLYNKVTSAALGQIEDFLPLLANGNYKKNPQDDTKANYWRKRGKIDGEINFRMSSLSIYNLTRALARPYPGAHIIYGVTDVKIWKVECLEYQRQNIEPGKVLEICQNEITVKTADGAINILDHEFKELPLVGTYL